MKREIKFRAWDGVLHEYRTIDVNSGKQNLGMGFEATKGIGSNTTTIYHSFGDVIEQFTGLKDANGQEIYEGDIVRVQETMDGGRIVCLEAIASVVWNDERGCWGCEGGFEGHLADYAFGTILNVMGNVCEVIGNVHENPELLEAEK